MFWLPRSRPMPGLSLSHRRSYRTCALVAQFCWQHPEITWRLGLWNGPTLELWSIRQTKLASWLPLVGYAPTQNCVQS